MRNNMFGYLHVYVVIASRFLFLQSIFKIIYDFSYFPFFNTIQQRGVTIIPS